jgi:uncharacterized protein (TIGR03437 family)
MNLLRAAAGVVLFVGPSWAQQYVISTVAGGAPPPISAPALTAAIGALGGVATDAVGNVYIVSINSCVFKLDKKGVLTLVAGNARPGYSGDGGPATSAQLSRPFGVAVDGAGNVFIADSGNSSIRKVATNGIITTVAGNGNDGFSGDGGPATSAQLSFPLGVAVDGSGNLFISDGDSRVRKVSTNGVITTVAGTGIFGFSGDGGAATKAQLYAPDGVAVDGSGNLYIADRLNDRIRKVATNGTISTVAGTVGPIFGAFSGDGGPATSAQLSGPEGVAVDGSGNLFITDYMNWRVRKVSTNGIITTVVAPGVKIGGSGEYWFRGVAVDGSGNLYIGVVMDPCVVKVSANGTITTVAGNGKGWFSGDGGPATSAQLDEPNGVAIDGSGNLYIADFGSNRIRKVSSNGVMTTVAGNGWGQFSGDGGPATNAHLSGPYGIAVDGSGNLYIADYNRIQKVSPNGVITTVAGNGVAGFSGDNGPATDAQLNNPGGVTVDGSGNLFIADGSNHRVRKVSTSGIISSVAGNGVGGFSGDGGPAASAQVYFPNGVTVDGLGNLFIVDSYNNRIRKISTDGIITTVAGTGIAGSSGDGAPATSAQLRYPTGIAVDGSGNLFIADGNDFTPLGSNDNTRKVSTNGIITTIAGNGIWGYSGDDGPAMSAQMYFPQGIAVDGSGNVFIADKENNAVRKLTPSKSLLQTITFGPLPNVFAGAPPFDVAATASSGLPVSLASTTANICTVSGSTVTPLAVGTCTITATQAGSATFGAATPATQSFTVKAGSGFPGGPPAIATGGIVPVGSTVSTIQSGQWISIYGTNLASTQVTWDGTLQPNGSYPTSLGNVSSVTFNGIPGYLWFVMPSQPAVASQINVQVPDGLPTSGTVSVVVNNSNGSASSTAVLGAAAPSLSLLDNKNVAAWIYAGPGKGHYYDIYDLAGPAGVFAGLTTRPVKAGESLMLYGVGFGPTKDLVPAGRQYSGATATTNPVTVSIGGVTVTPDFAGLVGPGLYQINVTVPNGAPGEQAVFASVSIGGVTYRTPVDFVAIEQ